MGYITQHGDWDCSLRKVTVNSANLVTKDSNYNKKAIEDLHNTEIYVAVAPYTYFDY